MIDYSSPIENAEATAVLGRTLDGKYRLDAVLGKGGMGTVYFSTRMHIGDTVAVKILQSSNVGDPNASVRFRREAQMAARLKHPNVVSIYDFGISNDGLMYLVMEMVEGQSLRQLIKQQGPLTTTAAATVATQVCAALDEAHRQNIVHRDIKPDNIVLQSRGNDLHVKVLDFGIAKLRDMQTSNLTQTGSVMGTPHYMSPEQCMGEELDHRSDIYSLGVVLYEALCGVVPFNSPTPSAVVIQHVNQAPPSLRSMNLSIPLEVEETVLHALAKRREARPQRAGELAQEMMSAVYASAGVSPSKTIASNVSRASSVPASAAPLPTIRLSTPILGNQPASTPSGPVFPSYPVQVPQTKKRVGLWIAVPLLLITVIGIAVAAFVLLSTQNETTTNTDDAVAKPTPTANPIASPQNSAEADLERLHERRNKAKPSDSEVRAAVIEAERKYPDDYRFTYEHARLFGKGMISHDEAWETLRIAAQKAIDGEKAQEMLDDMMAHKNGDFYRLARGHDEWEAIVRGLRTNDKAALKGHGH